MAAIHELVASSDDTSLVNVNMSNVTKLTATNFMMWSRQVHALLDGYDIAGYLDGSVSPPDSTLTNGCVSTPNPAYKHWKHQDKLIYSGLLGTISVAVQPLLSKAITSRDIWVSLKDTYAKPSRTHIKQIRDQLTHWKKGTKTIKEYVQGFTIRFDQLALLESLIAHEDQIDYILGGLPDDYRRVIDQIEGRDTAPTITEVHEKLINEELKLQTVVSSSVPVTANAVTSRPSGGSSHNRHQSRNGSLGQQQHYQRGDSRASGHGYQGRCQLCGVYGHSARRCSQLQTSGGYPMN
ncbi:PREDICTED: uncharacterized protein LOC104738300 [Camelina sativa]|uniref:Uncharacterized protein LOC104738300 n=1 Tax=Camelina sativa TaxID=90675 RepID=A0ABM0VIP5_CAMSA|nr:PREDICTED: uncharacterized protein LOC104738300 [Camelina sativa]